MTEKRQNTATPVKNPELDLAREFVQNTGHHIFLTGKAGTGKTTFLHNLKGTLPKRMIITAPTGVAAINAGGVTLHSFFQLPFGPFIPGSDAYDNNRQHRFRFSREKKRIIRSLDLLVIDEISMVRADLLDAVDAALRRHRRNDAPFGGVQLLMIGDLHQLSPVARPDDWQLLEQYYNSVYFFSSHALGRTEMVTIELNHIYRQSDASFIRLLNQVRNNRLDPVGVEELNRRYIKGFTPEEDQGYITLTTHNNRARHINESRLDALPGQAYRLTADISGDFPEHTYPTPAALTLKVGAQVMFLRNDTAAEKRFYNGKIGRIKAVSDHQIRIVCPDEPNDILVEPVEWENIKYTIDEENKEIREEIIGRFKQFPLKTAWAITIHKSQGLTFDKAVIDAEAVFSHGQFYVGLSRCKTLDGVVFSSPVPTTGISIDATVQNFVASARRDPPTAERLQAAKTAYQRQLLIDCFDLQVMEKRFGYLAWLLHSNAARVQLYGVSDVGRLRDMAVNGIFPVSEKFRRQLREAFQNNALPETDAYILERTAKACQWFQEQFALIFDDLVQKFQVETDNKELARRIDNTLNNFRQDIRVKRAGIASCENGFSPSRYLRAVSSAEMEDSPETKSKPSAPEYGESDIAHPEVFQQLKDWRSAKAGEQGVPPYQILHQRVLIQIAVTLPSNLAELKAVKGVGEKTIEKYGAELLNIVGAYREKNGIEAVILPEPGVTPPGETAARKMNSGSDSKRTSFDLFNQGISIAAIAEERGLVVSTIQSHLGFFVEKGELDINRVLSADRQRAIETALAQGPGNSLKAVKEALGDDFTYGDIKLMMAHQTYLASK